MGHPGLGLGLGLGPGDVVVEVLARTTGSHSPGSSWGAPHVATRSDAAARSGAWIRLTSSWMSEQLRKAGSVTPKEQPVNRLMPNRRGCWEDPRQASPKKPAWMAVGAGRSAQENWVRLGLAKMTGLPKRYPEQRWGYGKVEYGVRVRARLGLGANRG